ncbi:MAG: SCO family protein [Planctomycetota bacterium]
MRTRTRRAPLVIAILALVASAAAAVFVLTRQPPPETPEQEERRLRAEALASLELAEFTATAPDNSAFTRDDMLGQWTLLSFGFTYCELACPPMHANTMRLIAKLANTDLRFVTMSVDPVHDTPERLAAYTEQIGADSERWIFVAMEANERDRVLDGLGLAVTDDPSEENRITLPDGETVMDNIGHPTRFVLIAPDGAVTEFYPGMTSSELDDTARSIRGFMLGG